MSGKEIRSFYIRVFFHQLPFSKMISWLLELFFYFYSSRSMIFFFTEVGDGSSILVHILINLKSSREVLARLRGITHSITTL